MDVSLDALDILRRVSKGIRPPRSTLGVGGAAPKEITDAP
jgi:hypothetical protein